MSTILGNPIALGGGAKLNIDFGTTPPSDTSKLWVPLGSKPNAVECSPAMQYGSEYMTTLANPPSSMNDGFSALKDSSTAYVFSLKERKTYRYDFASQTYTKLSNYIYSTLQYPTNCCAVGKYVYFFGGTRKSTDTDIVRFNMETEAKETMTAITPDSYNDGRCCVAMGNKIYLFGGRQYGGAAYKKIHVYDTETDTVTTLSATLPSNDYYFQGVAYGTDIYLFGSASTNMNKAIRKFDTITNTYSVLSATLSYGSTAYYPCPVLYGSRIYIMGSGDISARYVQCFDIETQTVRSIATTQEKGFRSPSCVLKGNEIYVLTSYTDKTYKFTVETMLAENNLFLQTDFGFDNFWTAINGKDAQVKVYLVNAYLGDSNNVAQLTNAYLHNGSNWVSLSGESMTADMLAALATLGVT